jgi:hypothetical protein
MISIVIYFISYGRGNIIYGVRLESISQAIC